MDKSQKTLEDAVGVLKQNDRTRWTVPAGDLYPHQWLWDSCFIAIGLRHLNVERAQTELTSLLRGQWSNGMFPNMIFDQRQDAGLDRILWDSAISPFAPSGIATSGITQPPLLAEAVLQIGQKLKLPERRSWYKKMLPHVVRYHQWLYRERNPNRDGLVVVLHPYESGTDNSPPWLEALQTSGIPLWVKLIAKSHLDFIINLIRRDTRHTNSHERMSTVETLSFFVALRRLKHKGYDSKLILQKPYLAIQDLLFNCILIRANASLKEISKTAGVKLPPELVADMKLSEEMLEQLWDEQTGRYYSRNFNSGELIKSPSILTLLPLYTGVIPADRAKQLVSLLNRRGSYKTLWPVPSTPLDSPYFDPVRYWQGPVWINTNWLIIQGLKRYGFDKEAEALRERTLELVTKSGFSEYFDPLNGEPHGAKSFSWSAALAIDLLKN